MTVRIYTCIINIYHMALALWIAPLHLYSVHRSTSLSMTYNVDANLKQTRAMCSTNRANIKSHPPPPVSYQNNGSERACQGRRRARLCFVADQQLCCGGQAGYANHHLPACGQQILPTSLHVGLRTDRINATIHVYVCLSHSTTGTHQPKAADPPF